jgi:hypothetical protein
VTRKEAMTKWCPFAKVGGTINTSVQRQGPGATYTESVAVGVTLNREGWSVPSGSCMCIADKCMMWAAPLADPDHGTCGMSRWNG